MNRVIRYIPGVLGFLVVALCAVVLTAPALCCCAEHGEPSCSAAAEGDPIGRAPGASQEPASIRGPDGCVTTVERVLERYIEAVGGREAIEKLRTRTVIGTFTKDLHWDDPPYEHYKIVIFAKSQGQALLDEHKPGGRRMEGFDGSVNWVRDGKGVELKEKFYLRKVAWACNPQSALRVEQFFPDLSISRKESSRGGRFYVLETAALPFEHYALFFDKRTGLLRHIGYHWDVEDYREVDGVLVPHRLVAGRKGGSCTYQFEEIVNNTPLSDSIFSPPQ
jgi:hypothetical protein